MKFVRRTLAAGLLFFVSVCGGAGAEAIWTNAAGGSWESPANWSPNLVPGSGSHVWLTNAGDYTIAVSSEIVLGRLVVGGSPGRVRLLQQTDSRLVLTGRTEILPGGALTWRGGVVAGELQIESGGEVVMAGSAPKEFQAQVKNWGTLELGADTGDVILRGDREGGIENSGLLEFAADRNLLGVGSPTVSNWGIIRKSRGLGWARLGGYPGYPIVFENRGLVESISGNLQIVGDGSLTGEYATAEARASIQLYGGVWEQFSAGDLVVSGPGTLRFLQGRLLLRRVDPRLVVTGGEVVLRRDFEWTAEDLVLDGAAFLSEGPVMGTVRWRSGSLKGPLMIETNALLVAESGAAKNWYAQVTNRGTIRFAADLGEVRMHPVEGPSLENEGVIECLGNFNLRSGGQGPGPLVRNQGTWRFSGGFYSMVGGTTLPVRFENGGLLELSGAGQVWFYGGGALAGRMVTTLDTDHLVFFGDWAQGSIGQPLMHGPGLVEVQGLSLRVIDGVPGLKVSDRCEIVLPRAADGAGLAMDLTMNGGFLAGTNRIAGSFRWLRGEVNDVLLVESNAQLTIEQPEQVLWRAAVTNWGALRLTATTGTLFVDGTRSALLENFGVLEFAGDSAMAGTNGPLLLNNRGTIWKSGALGRSALANVLMENRGRIVSTAGTLHVAGNGSLGGRMETAATNARVSWEGIWTQTGADEPIVTGPGAMVESGLIWLRGGVEGLGIGTAVQIHLSSEFQNNGAITNWLLDGGTLMGSPRITGTLRWRSGAVAGPLWVEPGGTLVLESPGLQDMRSDLINQGVVRVEGTNQAARASTFTGGQLINVGLVDLAGDNGLAAPTLIYNHGVIRKSAGGGSARLNGEVRHPGQIDVDVGTLVLAGGGTLDGRWNLAAGGGIDLAGGVWTQTMAGWPVISGDGVARQLSGVMRLVDAIPALRLAGGTVELLPNFQNGGVITNLTTAGSTLAGPVTVGGNLVCQGIAGSLTVLDGGEAVWTGGTIEGTVTINHQGWLRLSGGAWTLGGGVTNRGYVLVEGSNRLTVAGSQARVLDNAGTWEIQGDAGLGSVVGSVRFVNTGYVRKSSGNGVSTFGVEAFTNEGVLDIAAGTVEVSGTTSWSNGRVRVGLRARDDFGRIRLARPGVLAGEFGIYLADGYRPSGGSRFPIVLHPNSASGWFRMADMPHGLTWGFERVSTQSTLVVSNACAPVPPETVAWWPGDDSASDVFGHGGILRHGASWADGRIGRAFQFDGVDDHVEVPNASEWQLGTNDFSLLLCARFRKALPTALTNASAVLVGHEEDGGQGNGWTLGVRGGLLHFRVVASAASELCLGQIPFNPPVDAWQQLGVTRSNGTYRFYLNGTRVSQESADGPIPDIDAPLTIGGGGGRGYWDGLLDEVILVKRSMADGEIAAVSPAGLYGFCLPDPSPGMDIRLEPDRSATLVLRASPGVPYRIERRGDFGRNVPWSPVAYRMTSDTNNSFRVLNREPRLPAAFFRAVGP